jgi:FkbM family methyltransferase
MYIDFMRRTILTRNPKEKIIKICKVIFQKLGLGIVSYQRLAMLKDKARFVEMLEHPLDRSKLDLDFIIFLIPSLQKLSTSQISNSRSQLRQDLFVLSETNFKEGGYFVEFGAANGIDFSNTYLLETLFSWSGILAEPALGWQKSLAKNRPNTHIENSCVWKESNSYLTFNETNVKELSTLNSFSDKDEHKLNRESGKKYQVQTISLKDLLLKYNAPKYIDYLSIDTEGSEYEILSAFDFSDFSFGIITVEHNFTSDREKIYELLTRNGYTRKNQDISYFDDWYVKN